MKLSFVKTIQGHEMEFVRLMYPLRYEVYLRQVDQNPLKLTLTNDGKGIWNVEQENELPGWVNEITLPIITAIEENEAEASEA
jgi:hypothetical protein